MLQAIRERTQGWFAWVIVFLITVPFALWGIQSYLGIGGEPIAAEVNGIEITQRDLSRRIQQARLDLRERLGAGFDPAAFDDARLRAEVLGDMIRQTLLLDVSRRLGMRAGDAEIRSQILTEPAFQRDGRFDVETYRRLLQMQGLSPSGYEAQLRQQLVGMQLAKAVVATEFLTPSEQSDYQRLAGQQREIVYARLAAADFASDEPLAEDAITAWYESHQDRFQLPEQVQLEYLQLDAAQLAAGIEISEDELRRAYAADESRFRQPERRTLRHILLTIPQDADEASAAPVLAALRAVRDRLLSGEDFAAVAREVSQDPGTAASGGDLGVVEAGNMDPAFDQAAFALTEGALSDPVRTRFGYHLIQVQTITPSQVQPFTEVRTRLRDELAAQRAETLYYDLAERLATIAYESRDSLEPAATELGLTIQTTDWIGREGGAGPLGQPRVIAAAFSDEVLNERMNSDLLEPEPERPLAIVLRVSAHRTATLRKLEEVRDEITDTMRRERAHNAALKAAEQALEGLRQGTAWSEVLPNAKLEQPGSVGRNTSDVPARILNTAFALSRPAVGATVFGIAQLDQGDVAVVQVTAVQDSAVTETVGADSSSSFELLMVRQLLGRRNYESMLDDMMRRASIERHAPTVTDDAL